MLEQAKAKLTAEMEKAKNNSYVQVVGRFLMQHLKTDPGAAEKIMDADKTIFKSLNAMRNEAEKKKVGNMAMFTPQEGFEIVMKYFGIEGAAPAQPAYQESPKPVPKPKTSTDFSVNLDDLLGG